MEQYTGRDKKGGKWMKDEEKDWLGKWQDKSYS